MNSHVRVHRLIGWALALLVMTGVGPGFAAQSKNELGQEQSSYLLSHASDPVHWKPWNAETLARAKKAGKPILLSIGYSSCHWCHVMRREAFSDPTTAEILNRLFFPIKLDREERPDVDAVYQASAEAMSLPSGWPLNMFLTPDAKPFWGGTYFPKETMRGEPAFRDVLKQTSKLYLADPKGIENAAAQVTEIITHATRPEPGTITMQKINAASEELLQHIDPFFGGFGQVPKFPNTVALDMLWRGYIRTGDQRFAEAVTDTLSNILAGGIYDHVGGGFFRYAVDSAWQVPHYEKMLDVNASLIHLMTNVWRETRSPTLHTAVQRSVEFILSELRLPGGAFAGSLDAESLDQRGELLEGIYYLWDADEIRHLLGSDSDLFLDAYAIHPPENTLEKDYGERGTLYRSDLSLAELSDTSGVTEDEIRSRLERSLEILKQHRAKRSPPKRDDKILADWNGMAITAIAEAGLAFSQPDWIAAASRAFEAARLALSDTVDSVDRLHQSAVADTPGAFATLRGLAEMTMASLVLFEATGDEQYVEHASKWIDLAIRYHWDNDYGGGFFASAEDSGPVLARLKSIFDDPNTSGNAIMAEAMALLYFLNGNKDYRDRSDHALRAVGGITEEPFLEISGLFNAADTTLGALQIVIVGARGEEDTDHLIQETVMTSLPNRALDVIAPGTILPEGHPARHKDQIDDMATAYVCRGTICSLPVTDLSELTETLLDMRSSPKR